MSFVGTLAGMPGYAGHRDSSSLNCVKAEHLHDPEVLLDSPFALCHDALSDTLYIAETGNHAVRQLNLRDGSCSTLIGTGKRAAFAFPHDLTLLDETHMIVVDTGNGTIKMLSLDVSPPSVKQIWPSLSEGRNTSNADLTEPRGCAYKASSRELFVTDSRRVYVYDFKQRKMRVLAGGGWGKGDGHGRRVDKGYQDGSFRQALFDRLQGAVYSSTLDCLFVCDSGNHCIRRIDLGGWRVGTVCGSAERGSRDGTLENARFSFPQYLTLSNDQTQLYITELNDCVRMCCMYSQRVSTLAGSTISGFQDGNPESAQFSFPAGIALDAKRRRLYVADAENHVVRYYQFEPDATADAQEYVATNSRLNLPSPPPARVRSPVSHEEMSPAVGNPYSRNFRKNLERLMAEARHQASLVHPFIFTSHYFQAHPPDVLLPLLCAAAMLLKREIPQDMPDACAMIASPHVEQELKNVDLLSFDHADLHVLRHQYLDKLKSDDYHNLPDIQPLVLWIELCEKCIGYNIGHSVINSSTNIN